MKHPFNPLSFFVLLLTVGLTGLPAAAVRAEGNEPFIPSLQVQGSGSVTTVPDEALVTFGVISEDKKLESAYEDNTKKINAILETVRRMGIVSEDVKTSSYNIQPVYPKDERGRLRPGKPVGFTVRQQLAVRVRRINEVGNLIDKVIAGGSDEFQGIFFDSSRRDELAREAQKKAAQEAKEKARLLAESLDVKLGRLLRVGEDRARPYPQPAMMMRAEAFQAAPDIQPGSIEITATCNLEYEILNP